MSDKLTIGYVLDDTLDKPDGVQQAMIAIGEQMRARGHEVHYIVADTERTDLHNIHSVARFWSLRFNGNSVRTPLGVTYRRVRQLFQEVPFDVLHIQMPYSPLLAGRIVKLAPPDVKVYGTFHILPYGLLSRLGTKLLGMLLWRSKRRFTAAYAVSPPALAFMKQAFGLSGNVLPNPVDYDFFHAGGQVPKKTAKYRLVFVGRFEERKGVRQLVAAFEALGRKDVELVMCGRGPLLEEIRSVVEQKKLNITLAGFVTEKEKAGYLASADIAVFPSTGGESFGIVLTEAMAAGAGVVIGGNNPGYASVLEPWPEVLFDPNDVSAFTAKFAQLLDDSRLRARVGRAQHTAVQHYDIKRIAARLERDYKNLQEPA